MRKVFPSEAKGWPVCTKSQLAGGIGTMFDSSAAAARAVTGALAGLAPPRAREGRRRPWPGPL